MSIVTTSTIAIVVVATPIAKAFKTYETIVIKTKATRETARVALHETLVANGVTTYEAAYPLANAWAAKAYGIDLVIGKGPKTGEWVMPSDHPSYEAARFARRTVLEAFKKEEPSVTKTESAETVTPATEAQKALFIAFMAASANKANGKAVFDALHKAFKG